jgi:hypothetical protein
VAQIRIAVDADSLRIARCSLLGLVARGRYSDARITW